MNKYKFTAGEGRNKVNLLANTLGNDLVVYIYNVKAHIGAIAIGEYDFEHNRASVSVITRLGHKDDALAQRAAYLISKSTRKPVCVIAGVHLDDITREEIGAILKNAEAIVEEFINNPIFSKPK